MWRMPENAGGLREERLFSGICSGDASLAIRPRQGHNLFALKTSGLLAATDVGLHHSCFAMSGTSIQISASSCQKAVQELSSGLKIATRLLAGLCPLTAQPHTHARSAAALT